MKSMVNKLLICSAALIGVVCETNGTDVVVMKEITETDSAALPVPQTDPWQSGQLQTETRKFDLSVTGNCKINGEGELKLLIKGSDIIPDLFALDGEKLIYAPYKPAATITVPRGHTSNITITLESIRDNNSSAADSEEKKYVCLGIRKKDASDFLPGSPLYTTAAKSNTSITLDGLTGGEILEIIPLVSKTNLAIEYTPVVSGEEVPNEAGFCSSNGTFDLSSVYRILVANTAG